MSVALGLLSVVAVVTSVVLAVVVLLQEPRGGGLAATMAGSSMQDVVGVAAGPVNRFTMCVAGVWMASCLLCAVLG